MKKEFYTFCTIAILVIVAIIFMCSVSAQPTLAGKTNEVTEHKVVLKDKYQRVQFTITKNGNKTTVKNRKGFTVRKFIATAPAVSSSYFRFNKKRVK